MELAEKAGVANDSMQRPSILTSYATPITWSILAISVLIVGTAFIAFSGNVLGFAMAFGGSIVGYESILLLRHLSKTKRNR